jgi:hypothetical protein
MNEITQYIQKLEARYEEVKKDDKTWYESEEWYRQGKESALEDVISELKEIVKKIPKTNIN